MYRLAKTLLGVFALALILSPLAAAEQSQITIPHNEKVVVLTLDLKRGDIVEFSWSANGSVTFRIEDLAGTQTFVDQVGQTGSGNWEVPADGSYVFQFRNTSDLFSVTVQWTVNHHSPLPPTSVYFLVALAIGVFAMAVFLTLRKKPPR